MQLKTDLAHVEDPIEKMYSSTKSYAKSKRLILQLPTATPSLTRLLLSIQCIYIMKRRGDSTHPCQSLTSTVNGCGLTLPTQTQTSEQEYCDLTACNRWSSTPYSRNTPQSFSRRTRSYAFSRSKNMRRHLWHTPRISRHGFCFFSVNFRL